MRVKDINLDRRWDGNHAMPQIELLRSLVRIPFRRKSIFRYELILCIFMISIFCHKLFRGVFNTRVIELSSCRFFDQQLGGRVRRSIKVRDIPGAGAEQSR